MNSETMKAMKKKSSTAQGKKEYLQFLIQRLEKHGSLPLCHLTGHLSQLPSDVRKCVGTSLPEVKIFLRKYTNIFDVDHNDIVHLLVRSAKQTQNKMKSPSCSNVTPSGAKVRNTDEIKSGKGKVEELFSQTGFIQAFEPFETPVYFTVQNFGDKSKQLLQEFGLKVGAVLHFDAVKEPPGSLTHYRATRIWQPRKNEVTCVRSAPQLQQSLKDLDHELQKAQMNKSEGKVEHVFDKYGFITAESTGKNSVFFHLRNIADIPGVANLREILKEGDIVEYYAVKSVKTDSLAPWDATHVFIKRNKCPTETSDDEIFVSSSESIASLRDAESPRSLKSVSKTSLDSENVRPQSVMVDLSPSSPQKASSTSLPEGSTFNGRIYVRSDDDAVIISNKRRSCEIAVVETDALYISGRRVQKVSDFQNGQLVSFKARKVPESHKWVATLVWVGDKPDEDNIGNENGARRNCQDNLGRNYDDSCERDPSWRIQARRRRTSTASHNFSRNHLSPPLDPVTRELVEKHARSCGGYGYNWKDEEEGTAAENNSFGRDMRCFKENLESEDENPAGLRCSTRESHHNETFFTDDREFIEEKKSSLSKRQSEVDGSLRKVLETSARTCKVLANKNADRSDPLEHLQQSNSDDRFISPNECVHKYDKCKAEDDRRFRVKQNVMGSPYGRLSPEGVLGCSARRDAWHKTSCSQTCINDSGGAQATNFPVGTKKSVAGKETVAKKFAKVVASTSGLTSVEREGCNGSQIAQCRSCEPQPAKTSFSCQEGGMNSSYRSASVPCHLGPKNFPVSAMSENDLGELESRLKKLFRCDDLPAVISRITGLPLSYLLEQRRVSVPHPSSSIASEVLRNGYHQNSSFCEKSEVEDMAPNEEPKSAFKDCGCQTDIISQDAKHPDVATKGVQTYSTGEILYTDLYIH